MFNLFGKEGLAFPPPFVSYIPTPLMLSLIHMHIWQALNPLLNIFWIIQISWGMENIVSFQKTFLKPVENFLISLVIRLEGETQEAETIKKC